MTFQNFNISSLLPEELNSAIEKLFTQSKDFGFKISPYPNIEIQEKFKQNGKNKIEQKDINELINSVQYSFTEQYCDLLLIPSNFLPYPFPLHLELLAVLFPEQLNISQKSDIESIALIALKENKEITQKFSNFDIRNKLGTVFLVGTGQNDPEMITLKAHKIIQNADVILYDSLINLDILAEAKGEKIFVGKRANKHYKEQHEINHLLYEAAKKHKKVVRVKGGDPMIFGHAGEEIAYLESHFVEVKVLPGITSALGASANTNIPLTLRNISRNVSFCTAHQKNKVPVPDTDTIVYFMGAKNLKNIAEELLRNNRPVSTPMKLIQNIGSENEKHFDRTIETILESKQEFEAPLLIIVGEVVDKSNWYEAFHDLPKILYTGSHLSKYTHLGYVVHQPLIEIVPLYDKIHIDNEIKRISQYQWLIFTSVYSVRHFFSRLFENNMDIRNLAGIKIASIGSFTSAQLKEFGVLADLQAIDESSEGLIQLFKERKINTHSILIPRSDVALNKLPLGLTELGNKVTTLVVYQNILPQDIEPVNPEDFDQIILTSPSGVKNFLKVYSKFPKKPEIIAKGKETKRTLQELGYSKT